MRSSWPVKHFAFGLQVYSDEQAAHSSAGLVKPQQVELQMVLHPGALVSDVRLVLMKPSE